MMNLSVIFPLLPAAINHLLAQEPWARSMLAAHAGKIAVLDVGLMTVRLKVASDGMLESAAGGEPANVTIRVSLADLPMIAQNRERAFSYVKIEGDADFAHVISQLSQSLRWEAEEDLSKWIGDIAATRVVAASRGVVQTARETHKKLTENAAEYFLEENPMLMRAQPVSDFAREVARLRDDLERLVKRIERIERIQ